MINIHHIVEGWGNYVKDRLGLLDTETQLLASNRLTICDGCVIRSGSSCDPNKWERHWVSGELSRGCGCNIAAKTLSPSSQCPIGKW